MKQFKHGYTNMLDDGVGCSLFKNHSKTTVNYNLPALKKKKSKSLQSISGTIKNGQISQ